MKKILLWLAVACASMTLIVWKILGFFDRDNLLSVDRVRDIPLPPPPDVDSHEVSEEEYREAWNDYKERVEHTNHMIDTIKREELIDDWKSIFGVNK